MADLFEVKTCDRIVLTAADAKSNELTQDLFSSVRDFCLGTGR